MYLVFIKYMYTYTKPFTNFENLTRINRVDLCEVSFTGVGGAHYCVNM